MPQKVIGTSTVQMGTSTEKFYGGAQLIANPGNTGVIYVGFASTVTGPGTDATCGLPLMAGAGITINPQRNKSPSEVYFIASASGQSISFDQW